MSQAWPDWLTRQFPHYDRQSFGDARREVQSARDGSVVVPVSDWALIRLTGEDAATFLHNMVTQDIAHLAANEWRLAGLCTAKGRLIATLLVWRDQADLLLAVAADLRDIVVKKLGMYVLRSKVKIAVEDQTVLLGVAGPQATAALSALGANTDDGMAAVPRQVSPLALSQPIASGNEPPGQVIRLQAQSFLLAIPAEAAPAVWERLTGTLSPAGLDAWHWLQIAAGQPQVVASTQEAFIPQMLNMELPEVGGVSFTKGCYPGQEIVARTQYLGKVKRRMIRAGVDNHYPPGTAIYLADSAGQQVGSVVSLATAPDQGYECLLVTQFSGDENQLIHMGSPEGPIATRLPLPYAIP